jgi:hypothetical protein
MLTDFVDGHDVGMVQVGGSVSLGMKTLNVLLGCKPAGQDHLERHLSVEADLPSLVDNPHAATALCVTAWPSTV